MGFLLLGVGSPWAGFERTRLGQQTGLRRVKPCASRRLRRSLTGQGLTRLAGPLRPGRAQHQPKEKPDEPDHSRDAYRAAVELLALARAEDRNELYLPTNTWRGEPGDQPSTRTEGHPTRRGARARRG